MYRHSDRKHALSRARDRRFELLLPLAAAIAVAACTVSASGQVGPNGITPPPVTFQQPALFPVGGELRGIAIGDVTSPSGPGQYGDPDGRPDVVVVNVTGPLAGSVQIFANTGNWSNPQEGLVAMPPIAVDGGHPYGVEIGLLAEGASVDPWRDIVLTVGDPAQPSHNWVLILDKREGSFEARAPEDLTISPYGAGELALANFDVTGYTDIAVAVGYEWEEWMVPAVELLTWRPDPPGWQHAFGQAVYLESRAWGLVAAELVRFGDETAPWLDLATSVHPGAGSLVLHNLSGYGFGGPSQIQDGAAGFGIAAGIFRPDKVVADLVTTAEGSAPARVYVAKNDGSGQFPLGQGESLYVNNPALYYPRGVVTGKLNADTTTDIAVACSGGDAPYWGGAVAVIRTCPSGSFFQPPSVFPVRPSGFPWPLPTYLEIGDLDRDGRNDLAVTCPGTEQISVLINSSPGF